MVSTSLSCWLRCAVLVSGVCCLVAGFQWQSEETLIVNGCVGSKSTIPWKFTTDPNESVGTINWFRFSGETVASFAGGRTTLPSNPDPRFSTSLVNADMSIQHLTIKDSGYYEVDVKILTKNRKGDQTEQVYKASAVLVVGDPPSISGETLTVEEVPSTEACAIKRRVTLRCGHFTKRGVPPVDVVWTNPAREELLSSRFTDGNFDLDLPFRPLPGNYTCRVFCQNPVLQCLPPSSPLLARPQIHLQPPTSDGCTDADIWNLEEPTYASDTQAIERLEYNLTEVQQNLLTLQEEQIKLRNEQSSGALQQMMATIQRTLENVQQNVSVLQQAHSSSREIAQEQQEQRIQDLLIDLQDLKTKVERNEERSTYIQEQLTDLANGLTVTQNTLSLLQDALNVNIKEQVNPHEHARNVTSLWQSLNRLDDFSKDTLNKLKGVREAQQTCERRQDNLTQIVSAMSARVGGMVQDLPRQVERAVSQCNATHAEMTSMDQRLQRVESGQALSIEDGKPIDSLRDPLVSKAVQTISMTSPWDDQSDSLLHDFVITPEGQVVIADRYHAYVITASNSSVNDVATRPLRYGTHIRRLTNMQDGIVAATVDDTYIYILDTTATDPDKQERWVRTPSIYHGIAARSDQTVFVGVDSAEGGARVDVISLVGEIGIVLNTLLNETMASELKMPAGLTVYEDELYVCDWKTSTIIRLTLQTLQVTVFSGPRSQPDLVFYQPRQTAFDASGNMYLTTGGKVCGGIGVHVYSRGFCVIVISQEGWWVRLINRGVHIYPYGLTLTPTGLAVSWGSWLRSPLRSLVQWYDLDKPHS